MIILHAVAPAEYGGLERVLQMLTRGLTGKGHVAHVAVILGPDNHRCGEHRVVAELRSAGAEVHTVRVPLRAYLRERTAVAELCWRIRPQVVHTHGYRADVLHGTAARGAGFPSITTLHGFTGASWRVRAYEQLQRRVVRGCDAVIAVSRPLAALITRAGVSPDRIEVIPNAWDSSAVPPLLSRHDARQALHLSDETLEIGWAGRLSVEKGADILVDAMAHLRDLPIRLSFLGDGPESGRLRRQGTELGLNGKLVFHGATPEAARYLSAFDACVLSSRTEGTPMVLFEAMAAGAPLISTRVGGIPDVVSDAEALLVPPEDPYALADAIRGLVGDPAGAKRRAAAARVKLEQDFAIDPWISRYVRVYQRVARS
ncbi:MAG TPA: glycosyltransferase family 4 protein [Solirubrobacteraceae bacterium]|nr:glycosyltransferase family 4 protein [Solirubrobacteraceae bacterium]